MSQDSPLREPVRAEPLRTEPVLTQPVPAELDAAEPVVTEPVVTEPVVTEPGMMRRPTGDQAVDDVLGQLDQVANEPLDIQIEVSERVHRVLQGRLADLGQE
jgi:hypothetical protein